MAVYQISRIQIRRGQKTQGTGMPQLASGELAWAIDTQELYIGNGAVSEGSPAVGNTKILTEKDSILSLVGQYQYKENDPSIQTGAEPNSPVRRSLQDRLDDLVSSADYGILSSLTEDQTDKIQNAIDNLFKNPANISETSSRVVLKFLPGTYVITSTIYLPSYVTVEGAGSRKTIFKFTGTGAAFEFVKDDDLENPNASIEFNTQPKYCSLKGFSIDTTEQDVGGFDLNCVRNSTFEDIEITGVYVPPTSYTLSKALVLRAFSSLVTTRDNTFNRVTCSGFRHAVYSNQDIFKNYFEDCNFIDCTFGIDFGTGTRVQEIPTISGEEFGPRKNVISNSYFENIKEHGIVINNGYGNRSQSNTFVNVGNAGGGFSNNVYSIISFVSSGNTSLNDSFDRQISLGMDNWDQDYLPEVEGTTTTQNLETNKIKVLSTVGSSSSFVGTITGTVLDVTELNYGEIVVGANVLGTGVLPGTTIIDYGTGDGGTGTYLVNQSQLVLGNELAGENLIASTYPVPYIDAFRIPVNSATGVSIQYVYSSTENNQMRFGRLDVAIDQVNGTIQLVDDFDYSGGGAEEELVFYARLVNNSLIISYKNNNIYNQASLRYSYTIIS